MFSPFRFNAKVSGALLRAADPAKPGKLNEKGVIVTYAPGSGQVAVQFVNDPTNDADYASLFGTPVQIFYGIEMGTGSNRTFQGNSVTNNPLTLGTGSVALTLKGKVDANGCYTVKSISGSITRISAYDQFVGKLNARVAN